MNSLDASVNLSVKKQLNRNDCISILATAAPILYAKKIQEVYHFDYVIATGSTEEKKWKENIRDEKKKNVLALLNTLVSENKISELYTDHQDDLPLMKCSEYTYLVNANEKTKIIVKENNIEFIIL